jgi:F-box/leucine-rich repeat protein 2/20
VITVVATCCPRLSTLNLTRCTSVGDAAIVALAESCPHLQELILFGCTKITSASVFQALAGCTSLRALNLSRCTRITDGGPEQTKGLQYLLSRMPHLEELGLARLKRITNNGLSAIATAPCVKTLQFLDLTACSVIGYTLREIAMGCRQLRTLYLSSCRDVTDETIVAFTTK